MCRKLLMFCICFSIIVAGCRKDKPAPEITPEGEKETIEVTLPFSVSNTLQSNMVIQREKPFVIWGKASTGQKISVKVSWDANTYSATATNTGSWKISIPASTANNVPQTITCSSDAANDIVLTNILIGDIWICSGQSNMVMQVDAIAPFAGVLNYPAEIAAANYPQIRALTVNADYQDQPLDKFTTPANWTECSPQTVGNFSAVAYFFARKLHTTLNVPVGIVVSAINGSWCENWTNKEAFTIYPELKNYYPGNSGGKLYNGMISPLSSLQVKGFIWYQGENNQHNTPGDYTKLNTALIRGWRGVFNQGQLPFYFVQLTPFAEDYNYTTPAGGDKTADWLGYFREAQANVLKAEPGTGMVITMDVGEAANHHPRDKKPVGERLALLALKNTYAQDVICDGPRYSNFSVNGNLATIYFAGNTANGLNTLNNQPLNQYFFVAGTDKVLRQGTAQIAGNTIVVIAPPGTPLPIQSIRYAFTNSPVTNIQNGAGLPMEPFRTDSW